VSRIRRHRTGSIRLGCGVWLLDVKCAPCGRARRAACSLRAVPPAAVLARAARPGTGATTYEGAPPHQARRQAQFWRLSAARGCPSSLAPVFGLRFARKEHPSGDTA